MFVLLNKGNQLAVTKSAVIFGKNMKANRRRRGLSQVEFGKALGAAAPTVSQWENGHYLPVHSDIDKIIEFFDTSAEEMFSEVDKPRDIKKKPTIEESIRTLEDHWDLVGLRRRKVSLPKG